ncbi:MAG: type II secretion system GspH family protein [Verrucomicrobia bacterium]|nr:type II secretion system GspH family protein [Verrucomicrobiota bacterium]
MKTPGTQFGNEGSAAPPTGCLTAREAAGPPKSRESVHRGPETPPAGNRLGFTLIEILAAMTILIVIVFLLGNLFTQSTAIWKLGTKRAYGLGEGRAVMEFLTRELSQSFADEVVTFRLRSNNNDPFQGYGAHWVYGWEVDEVYFISAVRTPDPPYSGMRREAPHYIYFVSNMVDTNNQPIANRFRLVRCRKTGSAQSGMDSAYFNKDWWQEYNPGVVYTSVNEEMETVAENVAAFEIWAFSEGTGGYEPGYYSLDQGNKLPLWVDLWLEMLSEEESIQMAALWAADENAAKAFLHKHTRRYAARVYFPNRLGYSR